MGTKRWRDLRDLLVVEKYIESTIIDDR